jgi:hypothetical protein
LKEGERAELSDDDVDYETKVKHMILPDGVLNLNTGFPIIIVMTKSDLLGFGEA